MNEYIQERIKETPINSTMTAQIVEYLEAVMSEGSYYIYDRHGREEMIIFKDYMLSHWRQIIKDASSCKDGRLVSSSKHKQRIYLEYIIFAYKRELENYHETISTRTILSWEQTDDELIDAYINGQKSKHKRSLNRLKGCLSHLAYFLISVSYHYDNFDHLIADEQEGRFIFPF